MSKKDLKDVIYYKRLYASHDDFREEVNMLVRERGNLKPGKWFCNLKNTTSEIVGKEVPIEAQESIDYLFKNYTKLGYSMTLGYIFKWHTFGEAGRLYTNGSTRLLVGRKPWTGGQVEHIDQIIMEELQKRGFVKRLKKKQQPKYDLLFL